MTHLNPKFAELGVRDEIVRALAEDGKEHPFAIQELTLPLALAGDDLIGQARTGMGKTLFEAITGRDYIVIQGVTIVVAIAYLVVNLVVDVSYAFLDPRIRLG